MTEKLFTEFKEFFIHTFPNVNTINQVKKLMEEAQEVYENESDTDEYIDIVFTSLGLFIIKNFSYWDIVFAMQRKLDIVKSRTWQKMDDGTYQHIKTIISKDDKVDKRLEDLRKEFNIITHISLNYDTKRKLWEWFTKEYKKLTDNVK